MTSGKSHPARTLLISVILISLLFAALTAGVRYLQQRTADNQLFAVLINNQQLLLDGQTLEAFNTDLARLSDQHAESMELHMRQWLERWLDESFALAHQAVPGYLDWYYSMPGSYSRLFHAVSGDLDGYLQQRMSAELIDRSGLDARFSKLEPAMTAELQRVLGAQSQGLRSQLQSLYADRQTSVAGDLPQIEHTLDIDRALTLAFQPSEEDLARWQVSSQASLAAGAGAFALVARRALVPRLMSLSAVQGARRVMAGFVVRLAPRMAMAISAGGSAAAVTAPSGPGALVAGGVAFITAAGTIVVTDFALLKAEELALREHKHEQINAELLATQVALRDQLWEQIEHTRVGSQALLQSRLAEPYEALGQGSRFHIFGKRQPDA